MNRYCTASLATILRMTLLVLLLPSNHVFADQFADLLKGVAASLAKVGQNNQRTVNSEISGTSGSALATPHSQDNQQIEEAQRLELARQIVLVDALVKDYKKTHSFSDQEMAKRALKQLVADLRANAKIENIASAETVAMVNGIPIPQVRINLYVKATIAQGYTDSPELRKTIKEDVISFEVVSQEAIKKGFDKQTETVQKLELAKQAPLPASATQSQQAANSGRLLESASQYCEAIESNKLIREFATQLARAFTVKRTTDEYGHISGFHERLLDNDAGDIKQWVYEQLQIRPGERCYEGSGCFGIEKRVMRWAGYCAAKHVDDELFLFFMHNSSGTSVESAKKKARDVSDYSVYADPSLNRGLWTTLIAISLPNGINALETTGKQSVGEFRAYLDTKTKEHEKSDGEAAEWVHQDEIKKKADREFANSPNGKLTKAYQSMAAINQCVEVREGYAMVYINDVQHTKAKKLMRRIEASLKNKLQGTTADELWKRTASSVDIQGGFISAKLLLGVNEIQVCQTFIQQLEAIGENVLGKSAPEKSW